MRRQQTAQWGRGRRYKARHVNAGAKTLIKSKRKKIEKELGGGVGQAVVIKNERHNTIEDHRGGSITRQEGCLKKEREERERHGHP